jgi:hypothetical protein
MLDGAALGISEWQTAHDALTRLARKRAGLDFAEGQWLRAALRCHCHARLGYGSFAEYIERLFGYTPRLTQEKLRVAEALENLPQLAQSLRDGTVSWSSLRELTRVATPETAAAWLGAAKGRTVREVEQLVSGRLPGDLPDAPQTVTALRHVLRFEVSGEVLATFREALAQLRRDADGPLDDDAALLLMARHVLEGPRDEGRASYQLEVTTCETCQRVTQTGRGQPIEVAPEVGAMARCDAQVLPHTHVGRAGRATQIVPPAVRRAVLRRDRHRCQAPGCRHATFVDVHHIRAREDGGTHEQENLLTLCGAHHRAVHRGELVLEGRASATLRFHHANGTAYGGAASAQAVDVQAQAFRALRALGFGEREARGALQKCLPHMGQNRELEPLLRAALALLASDALARAS